MDNNTVKIDLEIPNEMIEEGRAIYIMAGMETIAYKNNYEDFWMVKTSKCSSCGRCCKRIDCPELTEDNLCGKNVMRPFLCCISDPKNIPECTIKYEKVI